MTRTSLRLRLLLGAAVAIFAALALGWAGISLLFHDYLERREAAQLTALSEQVVSGLSIDGAGRPIVDPAPADPAFQSLSSGVYWQVIGPGGTAQSPSLWDQSLPDMPAKTSGWSSATVAGPFGRQLTLVGRRIQPDVRAVDAVVRVGANDEEMREALRDFDTRLALSLGLLWLVLRSEEHTSELQSLMRISYAV